MEHPNQATLLVTKKDGQPITCVQEGSQHCSNHLTHWGTSMPTGLTEEWHRRALGNCTRSMLYLRGTPKAGEGREQSRLGRNKHREVKGSDTCKHVVGQHASLAGPWAQSLVSVLSVQVWAPALRARVLVSLLGEVLDRQHVWDQQGPILHKCIWKGNRLSANKLSPWSATEGNRMR